MNNRQLAFCREYVKDSNGKQAAIRAGYAPKNAEITASQLLRVPKVKKHIDFSINRATEKAEYCLANWINDNLRIIAKAEKAKQFGAALKGQELLGKHFKFIDKQAAGTEDDPIRMVITVKRHNPLLDDAKT